MLVFGRRSSVALKNGGRAWKLEQRSIAPKGGDCGFEAHLVGKLKKPTIYRSVRQRHYSLPSVAIIFDDEACSLLLLSLLTMPGCHSMLVIFVWCVDLDLKLFWILVARGRAAKI